MTPLRFPPRRPKASGPADADSTLESKDRVVQQTDQDASQSRLSAVQTGYLADEFAAAFVAEKGQRRFPLINRGTYVRTTAIDMLVDCFLGSPGPTQGKKQIVSLGAGSDTRFFRLKQKQPALASSLVYHEFDFPEVTRGKIAAILRNEPSMLLSSIGDIDALDREAGSLSSQQYYIHPLDLRSLKSGCQAPTSIDLTLPTLFLSECCLIYLAPEEADNILKWITQDFKSAAGIVLYEPIGGDDSFGKVMIQNLAARGIVLKTLKRYSSLQRQRERLRMLGFTTGQQAADVDFIHDNWVGEEERARISTLEMLDEVEEWQLLARHYCIAWGWRHTAEGAGAGAGFQGWEGVFSLQNVEV